METPKAEHRGDVDDGARLLGGEHAARGLLRIVEHCVEIDAEHFAPFFFRHLDGAAGRLRDTGIVDQDGDGAERLFGGIEGSDHGGAVGNVGFDGNGAAAGGLDRLLQVEQPVGPPRHQGDGGAVIGQRLGELRAQAAGGAGHQRHAAIEIKEVGGFHAAPLYTPDAAIWNRLVKTARVFCVHQAIDSGGWRETTLASGHQ